MKRVLGLVVLLVGCGDSVDDAPGGVLVRTDAAGAECAYGGSVISSGVDANRNTLLEDGEIQVRTPVCNPAPRTPNGALTRLVAEPAGAHCSEGGTAIESGVDANGNGVLDPDEVTHTDYVCGEVLLTRMVSADSCPATGVAIQIGRDRDHDGQLSDDEVEHTEVSCGEVLHANAYVGSATDVAALANIALIAGDLRISYGGAVDLPKLQVVTGRLDVDYNAASALVAPELTSVEGDLAIGSSRLATLTLPKLARVSGQLYASYNAEMSALALPALTSVGGDLVVSYNDKLQTFDAPLEQVHGDIVVRDNPQLAALSWALTSAPSWLEIRNNGLTSFGLSVSYTEARPVDLTVNHNPQLTHIELSGSHLGKLDLAGPALTNVAVHAIEVDSLIASGEALDHLTVSGATNQPFKVDYLSLFGPVSTIDAGAQGITAGQGNLEGTKLVDLRAFKYIGLLVADGNTALTAIELGHFRTLVIRNNPVLTTISSIDALAGSLEFTNNASLSSVLLHDTTGVAALEVKGNPKLTSFRAPVLADVALQLDIGNNPLLAQLDLSSLLRVGYKFQLYSTALTTLSLPKLATINDFYIAANPALVHLAMPALHQVHILEITDNPHLPACEVDALFADISGTRRQARNDTTATCALD